jgi:hypothetical protein
MGNAAFPGVLTSVAATHLPASKVNARKALEFPNCHRLGARQAQICQSSSYPK